MVKVKKTSILVYLLWNRVRLVSSVKLLYSLENNKFLKVVRKKGRYYNK